MLSFRSAQVSDAGGYTCVAVNAGGEQQREYDLHVYGEILVVVIVLIVFFPPLHNRLNFLISEMTSGSKRFQIEWHHIHILMRLFLL